MKIIGYRDSMGFNAAIYCLGCVADGDKVSPVHGNPHGSTCELCGKRLPRGTGVADDHPNESFNEQLHDENEQIC